MRFTTPAHSPGNGVETMSDFVMKTSEGRGRCAIACGQCGQYHLWFFLVEQGNRQLLRKRAWLEIPIHLVTGQRALISINKDPSGDHVRNELTLLRYRWIFLFDPSKAIWRMCSQAISIVDVLMVFGVASSGACQSQPAPGMLEVMRQRPQSGIDLSCWR